MKEVLFTIKENAAIAPGVFKMRLEGDTSAVTRPGQFVSISVESFFLRRPFSVCDRDRGSLTVCYRVTGGGTEKMSSLGRGERLSALTGLGNGFDTEKAGDRPLLIGGGMGATPLLYLARALVAEGKSVTAALGFKTAKESILISELEKAGARVLVCTEDGSLGEKGLVTELMARTDYSYFYACGPEAMLRAVEKSAVSGGEMSLEARMGCGFGACMGCSIETISGAKRVCRDGPVFERGEVIWTQK